MVWSVWGRALIMASVMSVTAWNFCQLPLLVPEELIWQKELTAFCYDRLSFAFLQMASDIHPVINSVHIAVAVSLSWFVCAFPTLILRRLLRKRDGRQATPLLTTSPSLCTLFILSLHLAAEWKCRWKHALVSHCPFELMLGIALEALSSWKVSQFHKVKITPLLPTLQCL